MSFLLALVTLCLAPPRPLATPATAAPAPDVAAGISLVEAFPPEELALGGGYGIAVVTVMTGGANGTFARPPEVVVNVERVLAGAGRAGRMATVWEAPPSDVDWGGPSAERARRVWAARPLAAPAVGSTLIVLMPDGGGIAAALREPWSEAAEAAWQARIERARVRHRAEATQARAEAQAAVAADAARIATADLAKLVDGAEEIVVATLTTRQDSGESRQLVPVVIEGLRVTRGIQTLELVSDAERGLAVGGTVLVFARAAHWPSRFGGEVDGTRLVGGAQGVLPATPERLAEVRALVLRARHR